MTSATPDKTHLGILAMITFAMLGPFIDLFAKLTPPEIAIGQVQAARFTIQGALLTPIALFMGWAHLPDWCEIRLHLVRAFLVVIATGCFVAALRYMPIADALAIFFIEPLLLTLMGGWILGESVGPRRIIASLIGFGGALLIIQPSFQEFGYAALLPLGTAFCFVFYMLLTRGMAQKIHPVTLQAYTALAAILLIWPVLLLFDGSDIAALDPSWPSAYAMWTLLGVGIAATVSHIFISIALSLAPAATIAPLQYLEIVSATLLGYLFFSDFPDATMLAGMGIIVGSGLFVFSRERKIRTRPTPPP